MKPIRKLTKTDCLAPRESESQELVPGLVRAKPRPGQPIPLRNLVEHLEDQRFAFRLLDLLDGMPLNPRRFLARFLTPIPFAHGLAIPVSPSPLVGRHGRRFGSSIWRPNLLHQSVQPPSAVRRRVRLRLIPHDAERGEVRYVDYCIHIQVRTDALTDRLQFKTDRERGKNNKVHLRPHSRRHRHRRMDFSESQTASGRSFVPRSANRSAWFNRDPENR